MGIFGTSQSEEQQLRDASNVQETSDQASSANLSAYATAEEDLNETDEEDVSNQTGRVINGTADAPDSSDTDTGSYMKDVYGDEKPSEKSYPDPEYNISNERSEGKQLAKDGQNEKESLEGTPEN